MTTSKTLETFVAMAMAAELGCSAIDGSKAGSGGAPTANAGGSITSGGVSSGGIAGAAGNPAAGGVAAGGSGSGGASGDCPESIPSMCGMVAAHNAVRAAAPAANPALPLMTWDSTLADFAQTYASTCPAGHNPNRTVEGQTAGENMFFTSQRSLTPSAQVVQAWASEQANYAYPANTCGGAPYTSATFSCSTCPECGHYTQIVWRTTIKVGCGVASGCSGSFPQVWVCDYLPAGNMVDRNGNLQLPY